MSQSLSQVWVHIIFSTKGRYPFLRIPSIQLQLYDYINDTCRKQGCSVAIANGTADHIHILVSLSKNLSASSLVEKIKKSSSKWIKTLYALDPSLRKFYWQNGYGIFSVSQSNLEKVRQYIKNQAQHHKKQTFQEEFRKFLTQYDVAHEEKYLWN